MSLALARCSTSATERPSRAAFSRQGAFCTSPVAHAGRRDGDGLANALEHWRICGVLRAVASQACKAQASTPGPCQRFDSHATTVLCRAGRQPAGARVLGLPAAQSAVARLQGEVAASVQQPAHVLATAHSTLKQADGMRAHRSHGRLRRRRSRQGRWHRRRRGAGLIRRLPPMVSPPLRAPPSRQRRPISSPCALARAAWC